MKKALKFLSSLKLAVIVICSIATITAIGTFVESKYDAVAAKKLVYDSVYMAIIMGVFAVNLIAVMVDRWPWKLRHISFICAHIGILCIMTGQLLTNQFGIDGSMRVGIQDQNSFVSLPAVDVTLYTTFDGNNYTEMKPEKKGFDWFGMKSPKEVDFFKNPPTAEHPYVISQVDGGMKFTDYYRYAVSTRETVASENQKLGSGVRFQLATAWLIS